MLCALVCMFCYGCHNKSLYLDFFYVVMVTIRIIWEMGLFTCLWGGHLDHIIRKTRIKGRLIMSGLLPGQGILDCLTWRK